MSINAELGAAVYVASDVTNYCNNAYFNLYGLNEGEVVPESLSKWTDGYQAQFTQEVAI